jgi:hypothetical protein
VLIALPPRFGTAWIISPLRCVGSVGVMIWKLAGVLNPPLALGRKVDVGDDPVVVGIIGLEFTKYAPRVDRIGTSQGRASRFPEGTAES